MTSEEAWKRAQFSEQFDILKNRIQAYENREITKDALINAVGVWLKIQNPSANRYDPGLEEKLRKDWVETGSIEVFRHYGALGMNQRDMARVCGVSASAISRWLRGTRTKKAKKIKDPTLQQLIERANR